MTPPRPVSVSDLTAAVKSSLEADFAEVSVRGEVTNLTRAASGHYYFKLKDSGAIIDCAMWRSFGMRLRFEPKDGLAVVATGGVSVYAPRGGYQLICNSLEVEGEGTAELELRLLREKLMQRGYFRPERKRPLPMFPVRIALVASPTGAAIRDMLELLRSRWPVAEVIVRPSRVQGDGAPEEIAAALRQLNHYHLVQLKLCAVVLGRGGGSAEDLAAFNTELVAQAVFESAVPVVSAVGHETDVSLADLVADYRALTPSEAIVRLVPNHVQLADELMQRGVRLREALHARFELARQRLDLLAARPAFQQPLARVRQSEQRLDELTARLGRAAEQSLEKRRLRLAGVAGQLSGLSPLNVLARGYSLTRTAEGAVVSRSAGLVPGQLLTTRFAEGEAEVRVQRVIPKGES